MSFARPTLVELIQRARAELRAVVGDTVLARRSLEDVLARTVAGLAHGLHGHLAWVAEQILPDRAEREFVLGWARVLGLERGQASRAEAVAFFTTSGTIDIPVGSILLRDDAFEYEVVETQVFSGSTIAVFRAVATGPDGNADPGTVVTLASPIAGVISSSTIQSPGATGGADMETIEALRRRVLRGMRSPAIAGGEGAYEAWALQVPGVMKAWEVPLRRGAGTVDLFFVDGFEEDGEFLFPASWRVDEVQAYLDEVAPILADVQVIAPTAQAMNVTVALTPNTPEVQAAVEAELEALLFRHAAPGATIRLTHIAEAISAAAGEVDHTLTVPAADFVPSSDAHIAVLGAITFASP